MNRTTQKYGNLGQLGQTGSDPDLGGNSLKYSGVSKLGHLVRGEREAKKEKDRTNTFSILLDRYRMQLELSGRPVSKIFSSLKVFLSYLEETDTDPLGLQVKHAEDFQTCLTTWTGEGGEPRYRTGSVGTIMGNVSALYGWLKDRGAVVTNPFPAVTRLKQEKQLPKNIPDEKTTETILAYFRDFRKGKDLVARRKLYRAHVLAEVMYSCGCRIHEAAAMKTEDVDVIRGTIRIHDSKTRQERLGILGEYALKVLRFYVDVMREYVIFGKNGADTTLLFGSKSNLKIFFNRMLKEACQAENVPVITSHGFRHAVGFHLLKNGCDIRYIQEILGHRALASTQIYTRVDREDLSGVIDAYHPRRLS